MVDLAIISGTRFYDFPGLEDVRDETLDTRYGEVSVTIGNIEGKTIAYISRHGKAHRDLSNMVNYRAHLLALKRLDTKAVVATTVCGVLDPSIPLAKLAVFDDLYFPDNRLPGGEACTVYDTAGEKSRGHYIFDNPFSEELRQQIIAVADNPITDAVYAYASGPRFNSRSEIAMFRNYASFISQTAGPEVVLAGELEIPLALLGFGVDYANGIQEKPTPVEVLDENLRKSKGVFLTVIRELIKTYKVPEFGGFVYRFE
ncbi:MAG: MTAP family purine nucleoside phosphorylase [Candidatus Aminicenantes bacterium]|nr:MTAP family purine nucleoside phosphorylase [Candidatus Aminicenantes bacterium]